MAPPALEEQAGGLRAIGRPGHTPRPEPRPEVIEEEEEFTEIQSDVLETSQLTGTPIILTPQPPRSPGAQGGGVGGSPDSTSTSESGAVPTRLELQRQIKQQGKLQQQIKSR